MASASTAPPSAAGRKSTNPTCSSCPIRPPRSWTRSWPRPPCRWSAPSKTPSPASPMPAIPRRRRPARPSLLAAHPNWPTPAFFGPEAEFFIFDNIRFDQQAHLGFYEIDSQEGRWNSGSADGPNLGYKPDYKGGYFPVPPTDSLQDIRTEMVQDHARLRPRCGDSPPRGGHGRPRRDRHSLLSAAYLRRTG